MDGIKNIEIKNFRGIDHQTIDGFSRVNIHTLAKTPKKGHQAHKYTYEGLSGACENDVELRGLV